MWSCCGFWVFASTHTSARFTILLVRKALQGFIMAVIVDVVPTVSEGESANAQRTLHISDIFFVLSPARMSRSHCRPCWHNDFLWSYWKMCILHVRHSWSSFRLGSHASCHMLKLAGHRPEEKKMLCVNACGGIQRISMCYVTDRQACVTCHFVYNQVDCTDVFHHLTTSPIISSCTHTFATP